MTKIKICGIRDFDTAEYIENLKADAVGFILCESKRRIDKETLKNINLNLKPNMEKVGVFMNQPLDIVKQLYEEGGLTLVQLHGDENMEYIRKLPYRIIKAFNVETYEEIKRALSYDVPYILLEGKGKLKGGNGNRFSWELLSKLSKEERKRLVLGGGINAGNVLEAINIVEPYMIDASSSLEVNGVKSREKIKEFINKIRG